MGTGSIPGEIAAGAWRWPPTPSSTEVKERVKLYLSLSPVPSWPVTEWNLNVSWRNKTVNAEGTAKWRAASVTCKVVQLVLIKCSG